jgi:hypothetical protein
MSKARAKPYSLRKVASEAGKDFISLCREIKGRRLKETSLSRNGDIAVSEAQLSLMPSLEESSLILDRVRWDEEVGEREVTVFQKPPNIRLLLCVDKSGNRYHVWVGSSRAFFKGMPLMIAPHPSSSLAGFWHVIGPVPRYAGDKSFPVRWREWKKGRKK